MNNYTELSRDPFARETFIRRMHHTLTSCRWCGDYRRGKGIADGGTGKLYRPYNYGIVTDGGREFWNERPFCSVSCYRAYMR